MAQIIKAADPYEDLVKAILELAARPKGWNSYDADSADPTTLSSALSLVHRFPRFDPLVPRPDVGLGNDGAVVLRWLLGDREVEILFEGYDRGEFSVLRRPNGEVIIEGSLSQLDPYKDLVERDVLGYSPH